LRRLRKVFALSVVLMLALRQVDDSLAGYTVQVDRRLKRF
jgi:hypothetical protein